MSGMTVPIESKIKYLRRRLDELAKLLSDPAAEDLFEAAKKIGHQVKGNASTFEFPELTAVAKSLEEAALQGDRDGVLSHSKALQEQVADLLHNLV